MTPHTLPGQRERAKARRRRAILHAALSLFATKGYEATTVSEIATAADVSTRTVAMYYASKLDLALALHRELADRLAATIAAQPTADVIDLLDRWLRLEEDALDRELAQIAARMLAVNPQLRAIGAAQIAGVTAPSQAGFASALGVDVGDPLVGIVRASISAAVEEYLALLRGGAASAGLHEQLMTYLRLILDAGRRVAAQQPEARRGLV